LLKTFGVTLEDEELAALIDRFDKNKDGTIDVIEFRKFVDSEIKSFEAGDLDEDRGKLKDTLVISKSLASSASKHTEITPVELYGAYISKLRSCNVNDSLLTLRLLQCFEDLLADKYLTCSQMSLIIKLFPFNEQSSSLHYSTSRVDFIIKFHSRLSDPINFDVVLLLSSLTPNEIAMLQYRLGILNIWSPLKPEGFLYLDLSRREDRQLLRILLVLSLQEGSPAASIFPGSEKFWTKPDDKESLVPDFKIPATWYKESDLPTQGMVSFRYFSGDTFASWDCKPNVVARVALSVVTLPKPYAKDTKGHYRPTILRAEAKSEELGMQLAFSSEMQVTLCEKKKWIRKIESEARPATPPPSEPMSPRDDASLDEDKSTVDVGGGDDEENSLGGIEGESQDKN